MAFPSTQMGRQLLAVTLQLPDVPSLVVATAHLESTKAGPLGGAMWARTTRLRGSASWCNACAFCGRRCQKQARMAEKL